MKRRLLGLDDETKNRYLGRDYLDNDRRGEKRDTKTVVMGWRDEDDTSSTSLPVHSRAKAQAAELPSDRHWSQKALKEMTERDWRIFREDHGISIQDAPSNGHPPLRSWEDARHLLGHRLLSLIERVGYREPTPVQRVVIPLLATNPHRDIVALAETGSGKTAAFILPLLRRILLHDDEVEGRERERGREERREVKERDERDYRDRHQDHRDHERGRTNDNFHSSYALREESMLFALILTPTRELALQIEQEASKFARPLGIGITAIVGGQSISAQSMRMMTGKERVRVVVATPGRLRDCLEQRVLSLESVRAVVLDEADRMIDMNFEEDLQWILAQTQADAVMDRHEALRGVGEALTSSSVQRLMFSATMPQAVEQLAHSYLKAQPIRVTIGQAGKVVERVEQHLLWCAGGEVEKPAKLLSLLSGKDLAKGPIMIFVNQKSTVDAVVGRLQAHGWKATGLHGGRSQDQREQAMAQVRAGQQDILVATDVAGRGVDIPGVQMVINYDMSKSIEDYIHRVGRTGRAGAHGLSLTMLTEQDASLFWDLRQLLLKSPAGLSAAAPSEFIHHPASKAPPGTGAMVKRRTDDRVFAYGV